MSETVTLHGYQFSVYTRIAKMAAYAAFVSRSKRMVGAHVWVGHGEIDGTGFCLA